LAEEFQYIEANKVAKILRRIKATKKIQLAESKKEEDLYLTHEQLQEWFSAFQEDLDNDKLKKGLFLKHYYEHSNEEVLSEELEYCMIFISALGILNYTKRVEDKEFEKLGLKMLEDVVNYYI